MCSGSSSSIYCNSAVVCLNILFEPFIRFVVATHCFTTNFIFISFLFINSYEIYWMLSSNANKVKINPSTDAKGISVSRNVTVHNAIRSVHNEWGNDVQRQFGSTIYWTRSAWPGATNKYSLVTRLKDAIKAKLVSFKQKNLLNQFVHSNTWKFGVFRIVLNWWWKKGMQFFFLASIDSDDDNNKKSWVACNCTLR